MVQRLLVLVCLSYILHASVLCGTKPQHGPCSGVQVLIAGGSSQWCAQYDTPASNESYLVDVTPGANHTPALEHMTYRRVVSPPTTMHTCILVLVIVHTPWVVTHLG